MAQPRYTRSATPSPVQKVPVEKKQDLKLAERREEKSKTSSASETGEFKYNHLLGAQVNMYKAHLLRSQTAYIMTAAMDIIDPKRKLDLNILTDALVVLVERHEALRSFFIEDKGHIYQVTTPVNRIKFNHLWPLRVIDGSQFANDIPDVEDLEKTLTTLGDNSLRDHPINLTEAECSLWRAELIKFSETNYQLLLTFHHIIFDIYSQNLFLDELSQIYNSLVKKSVLELPELPSLSEITPPAVTAEHLDFWRKKLAGSNPPNLLPDFEQKEFKFEGERIRLQIDRDLIEKIKLQFVKEKGPTPYSIILTALYILFYRYTGQTDLVILTASANRRHDKVDITHIINGIVNTIPLREIFSSKQTVASFILQVAKNYKEALAQQIPTHMLPQNKTNNVMFVLNKRKVKLALTDMIVSAPKELNLHNAKFNLSISLDETDNGLEGLLEVNRNLFKPEKFKYFNEHLVNLLKDALENPNKKLCELNMLAPDERYFFSRFHQQTKPVFKKYPHELLTECATLFPDKPAVFFHYPDKKDDEVITYGELCAESKKLAGYLQKNGCGPRQRVGICVNRSMNLVIATFAAMYSGATAVKLEPIDTAAMKFKVKDAKVTTVISDDKTDGFFKQMETQVRTVNLDKKDKIAKEILDKRITYTPPTLTPDSIISIEYTSGSTGYPKGVPITQRGMANIISNLKLKKMSSDDKIGSNAANIFDAFNWDWAMAFAHGAELHYVAVYSPQEIRRIFIENKITIFMLAAQIIKLIGDPDDFPDIRESGFTGSKLDEQTAKLWQKAMKRRGGVFVNGYGPTENTIASMVNPFSDQDTFSTIGKPLSGTDAVIVNIDDKMNEQPPGKCGEIWLTGEQLALGYLNLPELTAAKFPLRYYDPTERRLKVIEEKKAAPRSKQFDKKSSVPAKKPTRWYATGDIGHIDPVTGKMVYDYRMDSQVKVAGVRMEITGIKAVMLKHADLIKDIEIIFNPDTERFTHYIEPRHHDKPLSERQVKLMLHQSALPAAAQNIIVINLESIPLTINGKINTSALKQIEIKDSHPEKKERALSKIESQLKLIWKDILGIKNISLEDNFAVLQGDNSILAANLEVAVNGAFNLTKRFSIASLKIEDGTLERMAAIISSLAQKSELVTVVSEIASPRHAPSSSFFSLSAETSQTAQQTDVLNPLGLAFPFA